MSYLATIFLIGLLIFIHELGHLLAAWAVGIPVARFSIGFGPVVARWRRNEVEYCVSLVPLGGYVLPRCETEADFMRIPAARRIALSLGGPAANFFAAGLLLAAINWLTQGFSISGVLIAPWIDVVRQRAHFIASLPGVFMHPDQLSGIVGIVAIGNMVVGGGLVSALRFAVLLNLNLAIFNLLPIAPLDGGKIFCTLAEKIHPRLVRLQTGFAVAGLALLLVLLAYTTVLDIVRHLA